MKQVSLKKLTDDGLLFEINRQVLHPLGLSLAVMVNPSNQSAPESLALLETDDDEGVLFPEDRFIEGATKFSSFMKRSGESRIAARIQTIGFIRQSRSDQLDLHYVLFSWLE